MEKRTSIMEVCMEKRTSVTEVCMASEGYGETDLKNHYSDALPNTHAVSLRNIEYLDRVSFEILPISINILFRSITLQRSSQ